MDFRPIFLVIGLLLATLALMMLIPTAVDFLAGNPDWEVFAISSGVTLFVGVAMALTSRAGAMNLSIRQAFLMTTLSWLTLTFFASLPFVYTQLGLSFTDAFFEAMSGITTTGSTVITGLDGLTTGILLWRALLQWLGGIGIIVTAIAILPMLRIGGMQLFRAESSDQSERVLPRTAQLAGAIFLVYLALTVINALAYWLAGMTAFQAICHGMTTIATGGYSTSDRSFALFDNPAIEGIAIVFMILGSLPFVLYLQAVRGGAKRLWRDTQVRWFMGIVLVSLLALSGWLWLAGGMAIDDAVRYASFNAISILTGTGYSSANFGTWGSFALPAFTVLMFIGGCTGGTTGGIKVFRFQVLYATARVQIQHLIQPHGVFPMKYNHRPIPETVPGAVMGFFFLFVVTFAVLAMGLSLMGLDYITSISGAATALANVGPGLGPIIGPSGTFQSLPEAAKWLLSFGMLLGRLELFTVLILIVPAFWRD